MAEPFPEIVAALRRLPKELVLDGELVVPGMDGRSHFEELRRRNLLQRRAMIHEAAAKRPGVLVVFDLLAAGGEDLRSLPLLERRHRMHEHVEPVPGVKLVDHVETYGEALFHAIAAQDFEGIVAKRLDSPYRAGRQPTWLKVKNRSYSRVEALGWR